MTLIKYAEKPPKKAFKKPVKSLKASQLAPYMFCL